jgi:hypothetical protein
MPRDGTIIFGDLAGKLNKLLALCAKPAHLYISGQVP